MPLLRYLSGVFWEDDWFLSVKAQDQRALSKLTQCGGGDPSKQLSPHPVTRFSTTRWGKRIERATNKNNLKVNIKTVHFLQRKKKTTNPKQTKKPNQKKRITPHR